LRFVLESAVNAFCLPERYAPLLALVAFVMGVAAWLLRGRLRVGVGEGLAVAGMSGGVLLLCASGDTERFYSYLSGRAFTLLAAVWYLLGSLPGGSAVQRDRSHVLRLAAVTCGALALPTALTGMRDPEISVAFAAWGDLIWLIVLAALAWAWRGGRIEATLLALVVLTTFAFALPLERMVGPRQQPAVALSASIIALVIVIGCVVVRWWRLRRGWRNEPQHPVSVPPWPAAIGWVAGLAGVVAALLGLRRTNSLVAAASLSIASLACLIAGHVRRSLDLGQLGLGLLGLAIVAAACWWSGGMLCGLLVGIAVAGGYMLWLARFWQQQLRDGVAWTTAGRLIPIARGMSWLSAWATLAVVSVAWGGAPSLPTVGTPTCASLAALALLATALWLARDACHFGAPTGLGAACVTVVAAGVPAHLALSVWAGRWAAPTLLIGMGATYFAWIARGAGSTVPTARVLNACVVGVAPTAILLVGVPAGLRIETVAGIALAFIAVTMVWSRRADRIPSGPAGAGQA